jgi:hypothetical protein
MVDGHDKVACRNNNGFRFKKGTALTAQRI